MILVYHHNDLDGICSAAIIRKEYVQQIDFVPVQYGKDTWNPGDVREASAVYVVDFTFPDMEKLAEVAGNKLVWIDHHRTAMEQHMELWESDVEGNRSLELSGCELTWNYLQDASYMPHAVQYIGDRDMWEFELRNTKAFCAAAHAIIEDADDSAWFRLLDKYDAETTTEFIKIGETLLKAQERRVHALFNSGTDCEMFGHRCRVINATSDISEVGEYVCQRPEYELAVMWFVTAGRLVVSLRSDAVDCAEIAEKYGGGGHVGAAGFTVDAPHVNPLHGFIEA